LIVKYRSLTHVRTPLSHAQLAPHSSHAVKALPVIGTVSIEFQPVGNGGEVQRPTSPPPGLTTVTEGVCPEPATRLNLKNRSLKNAPGGAFQDQAP
jgi:hypothetical protein